MKELGLRLSARESVLSPLQRTTYLGVVWDSTTMQARSDLVDFHSREESEKMRVTHCQTVSETVGSDGSCVQHDTFWPAVHETLAVVAQDQRVLPKGQSASNDQGHVAMLTCLRHVEETLVPVTRPRRIR